METARAKVIISGRVQGVFFRYSTADEAKRIGVNGWVRNLPDGNVEALFEGDKNKVDRIIAWCRQGPSTARVANVEIAWEKFKGDQVGFDIRY